MLDPFNGTGTSTYIAKKLNRGFIGIELSKKYCQMALQRLNENHICIKTLNKDFEGLTNNDKVANSLNEVFPYKEAFSPYLLDFLQERFSCNINSVFDPFCGVGSSFLNKITVNCFGFDTNPFALNITRAKLKPLKQKNIDEALEIIKNFNHKSIKEFSLPKWKSFSKYADKKRFNIIMSFIETFKNVDSELYHFMKYMILSNLEKMLDFKKDGNGIKFRKSKIDNLIVYLKELGNKALILKKSFDLENHKNCVLKNKSCIFNTFDEKVDCILTSPPYANLFDYFEVYKMELWSSGLVKDYNEWQKFKKGALRNNKNSSLNPNEFINNNLLNSTLKKLESINLENSTIIMLKNYFYDMKLVLQNCFKILKNKGFCFIVVGNSSYKGVPIKTDEILIDEAKKLNFTFKELIIVRKLNTSSQQMRILDDKQKLSLRESIIVLQKDI